MRFKSIVLGLSIVILTVPQDTLKTGGKARLLQPLQIIGGICLIPARPPITGEILLLVEGNSNPN